MERALHGSGMAGRWQTFPLTTQMAHIGSEVERAIRARGAGNQQRWQGAFDRALELFDYTAADRRWAVSRVREVLRLREYFCGLFFDDLEAKDPGATAFLQRYFLQFAVVARTRDA